MNTELETVLKKHGLDPARRWVVHVSHRRQIKLSIKFAGDTPSLEELHSLRRLVPQFRGKSFSEFREEVGNAGTLCVGTYDWRRLDPRTIEKGKALGCSDAGEEWVEQCRELGFGVLTEELASTSYALVDETPADETAEDTALSTDGSGTESRMSFAEADEAIPKMQPVCEELIRAGVAVEHYD